MLERKAVVFAHVNRLARHVRRVVTAVLKNAKTKIPPQKIDQNDNQQSTSQPEAEELQLFTAEVQLPETETQQDVLEIITAMANRETQETLCRSEVTQIYMTEQRRTKRTVPLGSPKSKQSSEFDASKNQPN